MSVQPGWITSFGSYSKRVTYPAGAALADVIDTVESVITALGWTLYDAAAGTNARAYRAVCADGSRYKYIVLDYNSSGYALLKTYESWNAGTHFGINLAQNSDSILYCQRVDLAAGGSLSISCTARYVYMQSITPAGIGSSTGNAGCGCFEIYPFNPNDTPANGYPCHTWINGYLFTRSSGSNVVSLCRTRYGDTGTGAAQTVVTSNWGSWGQRAYNAAATAAPGYYYQIVPAHVSVWGDGNYEVSPLIVIGGSATSSSRNETKGRIYGITVGPNIPGTGNPFTDSVTCLADSRGWPDRDGVSTACWVWRSTDGSFNLPK